MTQTLTRALQTLGTREFEPPKGLYAAVARALKVERCFVCRVAKGRSISARVLEALSDELNRRVLGQPITCTRAQLTKDSGPNEVSE